MILIIPMRIAERYQDSRTTIYHLIAQCTSVLLFSLDVVDLHSRLSLYTDKQVVLGAWFNCVNLFKKNLKTVNDLILGNCF